MTAPGEPAQPEGDETLRRARERLNTTVAMKDPRCSTCQQGIHIYQQPNASTEWSPNTCPCCATHTITESTTAQAPR